MSLTVEVTANARLDDLAAVQTGLRLFNEAHLGAGRGRLAVLLREEPPAESGVLPQANTGDHASAARPEAIRGGVVGNIIRDELFIDWVWVTDALRGQGWGARLLATAEQAAAERGVRRVTLNTFTFQAEEFYHKQGYQTLANIPDFMCGESKIYLRKSLSR